VGKTNPIKKELIFFCPWRGTKSKCLFISNNTNFSDQ